MIVPFRPQLNHIKEATNLLIMDKSVVGDEAAVSQIFSHLNIKQIKQIVENFKTDEYVLYCIVLSPFSCTGHCADFERKVVP
jgi:hypothetical protein